MLHVQVRWVVPTEGLIAMWLINPRGECFHVAVVDGTPDQLAAALNRVIA